MSLAEQWVVGAIAMLFLGCALLLCLELRKQRDEEDVDGPGNE
jgi:hypothetical protein